MFNGVQFFTIYSNPFNFADEVVKQNTCIDFSPISQEWR